MKADGHSQGILVLHHDFVLSPSSALEDAGDSALVESHGKARTQLTGVNQPLVVKQHVALSLAVTCIGLCLGKLPGHFFVS